MRKLEKSDYRKIAEKHEMKWLGDALPDLSTESTQWECLVCGKVTQKSYHRMQVGKNPCRCRSNSIKTPEDYRKLARRLSKKYLIDIKFPNQSYPKNTYQKVIWTVLGVEVNEAYHNVAYRDSLPESMKNVIKGRKNGKK